MSRNTYKDLDMLQEYIELGLHECSRRCVLLCVSVCTSTQPAVSTCTLKVVKHAPRTVLRMSSSTCASSTTGNSF